MATLDPVEQLDTRYGSLTPWVGWLAIVFFGACAVLWGHSVFDRRPQISVGPGGIWWRPLSATEIPWSEIAKIEVKSVFKNKYIVFHLVDPDSHPRKGKLWSPSPITKAMGGGDFAMPTSGLDHSLEEIRDVIDHFYAKAKSPEIRDG